MSAPAPRVLVVNAGSSSLKLRLLAGDEEVLESRDATVASDEDIRGVLAAFLEVAPEADTVGHRVVHGGSKMTSPVLIDAAVEAELESLADLGPVHNPRALEGIRAARRLAPELPAVACFDTAFHAGLPAAARICALPREWSERWSLRRYGFHGLSHAHAARRAAQLLERPQDDLRIVSAHLGAGASLAAVEEGRSVDTTMGFTPMEGLVMATRAGSIDPGLLLWVQRHLGVGPEEMERALDREAGLLGLSGSTDVAKVLEDAERGRQHSQLAVEVYLHRLVASVAAMTAVMGGLDALLFTGGVGENATSIRRRAGKGLAFLGIEINDAATNAQPEMPSSPLPAARSKS